MGWRIQDPHFPHGCTQMLLQSCVLSLESSFQSSLEIWDCCPNQSPETQEKGFQSQEKELECKHLDCPASKWICLTVKKMLLFLSFLNFAALDIQAPPSTAARGWGKLIWERFVCPGAQPVVPEPPPPLSHPSCCPWILVCSALLSLSLSCKV